MSFFEIFDPGQRYTRQQRELEKVLFVDSKKGGSGPKPLDLESGRVEIQVPGAPAAPAPPDAPVESPDGAAPA